MSTPAHNAYPFYQQRTFESRREREFYRYYDPIRSLSKAGPTFCDLNDVEARKAHRPFSSPDKALTAFCQLGAMRMGARRALMFFFDTQFAYILAEATRTLSLQDDTKHDIEDHLWLGHSIIPRGFSICEHTVNIPRDPGSHPTEPSQNPLHIINNLTEDTRFCDRPFVLDAPNARFYAGVPITTAAGINIGAYCILDDSPREGLSEKEKVFLREMSATVMTHLEMTRARTEYERGTRMMTGLGAFAQGHEGGIDLRGQVGKTTKTSTEEAMPIVQEPESMLVTRTEDATPASVTTPRRQLSLDVTPSTPVATMSNIGTPGFSSSPGTVRPSLPISKSSEDTVASMNHIVERLQEELVPKNVRAVFDRAAALIQDSIEVDGVVFLDAAGGSTRGASGDRDTSSEQGSSTLSTSCDGTTESEGPPNLARHVVDHIFINPCFALGSAYSKDKPEEPTQHSNPSERFLKSLLRRHPRGKIWNFDDTGACSDEDPSDGVVPVLDGRRAPPEAKKQKRSRIADARELQRLFPGVRHLAIVGMWNHIRERWFAGCLCWTRSPFRVFTMEDDVSYLAAFSDVIMAEVHRMEVQKSEKAKTDFISCISHELRSPLHGILGSVECLQDQNQTFDRVSQSMVDQIDSCGRTLLDIIDHLLDFSKINFFTANNAKERRRLTNSLGKGGPIGALAALDTDVALDKVTEDVVNAGVYSFACSRSEQVMAERKVSVVLDIDRSKDWNCRLASGAWKRICINLVSNALKYTHSGLIQISLKATPSPKRRRWFNAVLTVSDSGRGMTPEYLANHLFDAFSQEDQLVEGTGLGMSLVSKIVKGFGGTIEVFSEKGIGTKMTVTIPLEHTKRPSLDGLDDSLTSERRPFEGRSVGIFGNRSTASRLESSRADVVADALEDNCNQLGLRVSRGSLQEMQDVEMVAITEADLMQLADNQELSLTLNSSILEKPVIILCETAHTEKRMSVSRKTGLFTGPAEYIAQPYGPERLIGVIRTHIKSVTAAGINEFSDTRTKRKSNAGIDNTTNLEPADHFEATPGASQRSASRVQRQFLSLNGEVGTALPVRQASTNGSNGSIGAPSPLIDNTRLDSPPSPSSSERKPAKLPLLLVDDNEINLRLLETYAKRKGHRETTARDGLQAIEAYRVAGEKPRVILMDINMPLCDGFEATRRIRSMEQSEGLKPAFIIALTGLGSADAQREAHTSGVDMFLVKPVRLKDLAGIFESIDAKG